MYYKREERGAIKNGLGVHDYVCSKDYLNTDCVGGAERRAWRCAGDDGGGAQVLRETFHDGRTQ